MGSIFSGPKMPGKSEEQLAAEKAAKDQAERDKAAEAKRKEDFSRKQRANLLGQRSLQDEDISGFGGFRKMGTNQKSQGKSIRS